MFYLAKPPKGYLYTDCVIFYYHNSSLIGDDYAIKPQISFDVWWCTALRFLSVTFFLNTLCVLHTISYNYNSLCYGVSRLCMSILLWRTSGSATTRCCWTNWLWIERSRHSKMKTANSKHFWNSTSMVGLQSTEFSLEFSEDIGMGEIWEELLTTSNFYMPHLLKD